MLTELRPTGSLFAGKRILRDNSIEEAPNILHWRHQRVEFDCIDELYAYVHEMQYDNAIIVRGLTDATDELIYRRGDCNEKPENVFRDHAAALIPFDIDDFAIPAKEWMKDPRGAIDRHIVQRLGEPFSQTSYVAQFTGKHGLIRDENKRWTGKIGGDRVRVRILFITMRGLTAREAKSWLEFLHDTVMPEIDPRVGQLVQINYLARPKWEGHKRGPEHDPLGGLEVCWLVKRDYDLLPVPDMTEILQHSKQRGLRKRAENKTHAAARVANHPDALTAVRSIGLPIGRNAGQGDIYDHLLAVGRHLLMDRPAKGERPETHAAMLRDEIAALCQQHRELIETNLQKHGRGDDWPLIEHYLEADIDRWILWLIENGNSGRGKPIRSSNAERHENEDQNELKTAEMFCAGLNERSEDKEEAYRDLRDAILAERKRRREMQKEKVA